MDKMFRKEPYRLLFPLGIFLSHAGLGIWILYYFLPGLPYPGSMHAMVQMQGAMLCFVFGFLLTMLPNALGLVPIGHVQLGLFIAGLLALSFFGLTGDLVSGQAVHLALLVNFLVFVLTRFRHRTRNPPPQFLFIAMAMASGLAGGILSLLAWLGKAGPIPASFGRGLLHQGFLLLLVLGIGGILFPRLFRHAEMTAEALMQARKGLKAHLPWALAGLVLLAGYAVEAMSMEGWDSRPNVRLGYALRFAVALWMVSRLPLGIAAGREMYLHYIRIALLCIVAGLGLPILWPQYVMAWQHIVFIPGFLLLTLAVASRVIAAHGGNPGLLQAHRRWSVAYGILFLMGASARVSTDIWPGAYLLHLACASFFVLAALWIWSPMFLPGTLRIPAGGANRDHARAPGRNTEQQAQAAGHSGRTCSRLARRTRRNEASTAC